MSLPYDYYPAVLFAINVLSQGETKTNACDQANISVTVFDSYIAKDPELNAMYQEAEQRSYDAMADALVNIDNHRIHGQSDPKMAKVISDNIKWVLGKRDAKRFGEKVQIDHSVTVDVAITTALDAARRRTLPKQDDVVDATFEVLDDDAVMRDLLS